MSQRIAHRSQQHAGESASAVAADDHQLRHFRVPDELVCGMVAFDHPPHRHVGVAFLPTGQSFGQDFLGGRLHRRPVDRGVVVDFDVAPHVQGDEVDTSPGGLLKRDRGRWLRRGRAVDADQDRCVRGVGHQRVLVVNDRHRAVRMTDQARAHRAQHAVGNRSASPGTDDNQVGVFGQVDQRRDRLGEQHLRFDLLGLATGSGVGGESDGLVENPLSMLDLPARETRRRGQWRLGEPDRAHGVYQREAGTAHRGVPRRPVDRVLGRGRAVDTDHDAQIGFRSGHLNLPAWIHGLRALAPAAVTTGGW